MSDTVKAKQVKGFDRLKKESGEDEENLSTVRGMDKTKASFFAAVRGRGLLNAMLDGPAKQFEEANPGMRTRWEFLPSNGDRTMVTAREAIGFQVADASQLGGHTESEQKQGPVVRGDLILMYAPKELVDAIAAEDAKAAYEDWKMPETQYREHVKSLKVKLSDGTIVEGEPVGSMKRTFEQKEMIADPSEQFAAEGGE